MDRIHHVAIAVTDIARAVDWYVQHLDCVVRYQDATWAELGFANLKEPLINSSMSRVAAKFCCLARSGAQVVSGDTKPSAATKPAAKFGATRVGTGFAGELLRCTPRFVCPIRPSSCALHFIPKNRVRGHERINQRFLNLALVMPGQHPPHIGLARPDARNFGTLTTHRDGSASVYVLDPSGNTLEILDPFTLKDTP